MRTRTIKGSEPLIAVSRTPGSTASGRTLLHIPVVHTQLEMGSLGPAIKALTVQKQGAEGWARNIALIDRLWAHIEECLESSALPYDRLRIYQDGLPVCGRELEIVTELANAGSRNHRLLLRLKDRGAKLMGTESPDLLVQEYRVTKQLLAGRETGIVDRRHQELAQSLLQRRDAAIADRINHTLAPGETGILFLGMLHAVVGLLAKDIQVRHPVFPLTPPGKT